MDILRLPMTQYHQVWDMQRSLAAARADGSIPDTLILVEHPSVYTAGRRTQPWERPLDGTDVVDVDRGGKITWHGPGQLVGYPIVMLPAPLDVVAYVRTLEAALISSCAALGLDTRRVHGRSGVWTADDQRKIAAIGVRVRRRVTYHGFALNCCPDLTAFDRIVPCGITDAAMTSLSAELGRTVSIGEVQPATEHAVLTHLTAFLATGRAGDTQPAPAAPGASTAIQGLGPPAARRSPCPPPAAQETMIAPLSAKDHDHAASGPTAAQPDPRPLEPAV